MGIRVASLLNDAILFKQVQRFTRNPQLLVFRVFSSFMGGRGANLGSEGRVVLGGSWERKGLHQAKVKFEGGLAWKTGTGWEC